MLRKKLRLQSAKKFTKIFKEGQYAALQSISLQWQSTRLPFSQMGFIARKKHFAKAVDRNRAKRLLREAVRTSHFQLRPGFAIIVLYRYKPETLTLEYIQTTLNQLLQKNNLITQNNDGNL